MLERILVDIYGILTVIILTIITLLYFVPDIFLDNKDKPEDDDDS